MEKTSSDDGRIQFEPIYNDHLKEIANLDPDFDITLIEKPWHTASVATAHRSPVGYITFSIKRGEPAEETHVKIEQLSILRNYRSTMISLLSALTNRQLLIGHIVDQSQKAIFKTMNGDVSDFNEEIMRTELAVKSSLRIARLHPDSRPKIIKCSTKLLTQDPFLKTSLDEVGFYEIESPTPRNTDKILRWERESAPSNTGY